MREWVSEPDTVQVTVAVVAVTLDEAAAVTSLKVWGIFRKARLRGSVSLTPKLVADPTWLKVEFGADQVNSAGTLLVAIHTVEPSVVIPCACSFGDPAGREATVDEPAPVVVLTEKNSSPARSAR